MDVKYSFSSDLTRSTVILIMCFLPSAKALSLPGILSPDVCDDVTINETYHVRAACYCHRKYRLTTLKDLCGQYTEFGDCVHDQIRPEEGGWLASVFSRDRFHSSMSFVCGKITDAESVTSCADEKVAMDCENRFKDDLRKLAADEIYSEEKLCSISTVLGTCYWQIFDKCTIRPRHLWAKLAEAFVTWNCTKYGRAQHKQCGFLAKEYQQYPVGLAKEQQCLVDVETKRDCYIQEFIHSQREEDLLSTIEFDIEAFTKFSKLRCQLHSIIEQECINDLKNKSCFVNFKHGHNNQSDVLRRGDYLDMNDICRLYDDVASCLLSVLCKCPMFYRHQMTIFCAIMPASCHCPISAEYNPQVSNSPPLPCPVMQPSTLQSSSPKLIPTDALVCLILVVLCLSLNGRVAFYF